MKIKCVKTEKCFICGKAGSIQVFFNKQNEIKYGKVRHAVHKVETGYNDKIKYNFIYHKIEDLPQLETLLQSLDFQFPKPSQKLLGHKIIDQSQKILDFGHKDLGFDLIVEPPLGFEPRTFSLQG